MKPILFGRQLCSFPLQTIVDDLLKGYDCVPISKETAEILLMVSKNKAVCHVQLPSDDNLDIYGAPITEPLLWNILSWQSSCEKWQRAKSISDKDRDARFVFEANIKLVSRVMLRQYCLNPEAAKMIARDMILNKKFDVIQAIGVKKLITDVKEIQ